MTKPVLLVATPLSEASLNSLRAHFDVIDASGVEARTAASDRLRDVQIVLTNGSKGFSAEEIDSVPRLNLLAALGAGYENLDLDYARERGIATCNGAGTNDNIVSDHAMALLLATIRRIPALNQAVRDGLWRDAIPSDPGLAGKRIGLIGLGNIGQKIARRCLGFECEIGYHARRERTESPYRYFDDVLSLATWCDVLIAATPGGPATYHMINAAVLKALGPAGYVINIARGSVIDTEALAAALRAYEIAGAGLDVYESEPEPPAALLEFEQVTLTPHVAGRSPEATQATVDNFIENALRHLAGKPLLTPI